MGRSYGGRRSRVRIHVRAARENVRVALHMQHRRPNGWADRGPTLVQTLIGTMGISYGGRRSRVRIDVRAARANVRIAVHIQHRPPNGWADRAPHWYKHSLEQWAEAMGIGDRGCSLMHALRTQTCAQHHTYSIGARRAGPIGPQIVTKTHWGNGHKLCVNKKQVLERVIRRC
jgi:hypothetical protein